MSEKILIRVGCTESLANAFCDAMKLRALACHMRSPEFSVDDFGKRIVFHPILTDAIDHALRQAINKILKREAFYKQHGVPNHFDEIEALLKKKPAKPTP